MWWMTVCGITEGGVAKTDQSIRACVYPSYNLYDDPEKPGVLLASYTWSAEAEKIGALIDRRSPENEYELKELVRISWVIPKGAHSLTFPTNF